MNENTVFEKFPSINMCRVCLQTSESFYPMSSDHVKLYSNLVGKVACPEYILNVCIVCQWLLRRFTNFKRQCWTANNILHEAYKDPKSIYYPEKLEISLHLCKTSVEISQYLPQTDYIDNSQHFVTDDDLKNTINVDQPNENLIEYKFIDQYSSEPVIEEYKDTTNFELLTEASHDGTNEMKYDDLNDCDDKWSEDEIPLMLLTSKQEKNRERCRRKEIKENHAKTKDSKLKNSRQKIAITNLYECQENGPPEPKKLREGFSNRMVQETSEYIVIKKTKEEVLEEMMERAKSELYINLPYKCEQCVKGFNFKEVLDKHLEKHSKINGSLKCDMCGQYCPSAVSLRGHIKSHTTRYKCKVCGCVKASRQHLLEHHAAHLGAAPTYRCDNCPFTTDKRTVMQRHARTHKSRAPPACPHCGKVCKSVGSLRLHIARHDKSSRHSCPHCDKAFIYYSLLRRHIQCVHEKRDLYCVECDVHFTSHDSLRAHLKKAKKHRDTQDNKHVCELCGVSFHTASRLAAHTSAAHEAPRQYTCPHCPHRHYSSRDTLRAHIWRSHGRGDARATCHLCGTTFARKSTLSIHMHTHTGERAHVCECGAAFTQRSTLHAHIEAKHKTQEMDLHENKSEL